MKKLMLLNDAQLKKELSIKHAYDISLLIQDTIPEMQMRIISLIPINKLVDVFMELPLDISSHYFNLLSNIKSNY